MLKLIVNKNLLVPYIIIGLSFAYLISFIYYFINFKKIPLLKVEEIYLNKKEKRILRRFIFLTSSVIFSEIFFTYINIVMLGYFVESTFIGYYSAALSLINSSVILITFSTALLPIFTGLKKRDLNILYKKTMQIILISSTILFLLFLIFSPMIIKIIFGSKYILSVNLLRALSPLLILMPLISLSTTYLLAVGRPAIIFKILFSSILINILLNYLLISKLVISGQLFGVYGAIIATILTNLICIVLLTIYKNSKEKFKNRAIRVH